MAPSDLMHLETAGVEDPRGGRSEGDWKVVDYSKHPAAHAPVQTPPPAVVVSQNLPVAPVLGAIPVRPPPVLRASFQPTVPTDMFDVAVNQRVMTYLDNQQVTATVIWLGRWPGEGDFSAGLQLVRFCGSRGFFPWECPHLHQHESAPNTTGNPTAVAAWKFGFFSLWPRKSQLGLDPDP